VSFATGNGDRPAAASRSFEISKASRAHRAPVLVHLDSPSPLPWAYHADLRPVSVVTKPLKYSIISAAQGRRARRNAGGNRRQTRPPHRITPE
jgi:hypothetical protein